MDLLFGALHLCQGLWAWHHRQNLSPWRDLVDTKEMVLAGLTAVNRDGVEFVPDLKSDLNTFETQLDVSSGHAQLAVSTIDQGGVVGPIDIDAGRPFHCGVLGDPVKKQACLVLGDGLGCFKNTAKSIDSGAFRVVLSKSMGTQSKSQHTHGHRLLPTFMFDTTIL